MLLEMTGVRKVSLNALNQTAVALLLLGPTMGSEPGRLFLNDTLVPLPI